MSEWGIECNTINGKTVYIPYRIKDPKRLNHSGNREYAGSYTEIREAAETFAKALNENADTAISTFS